MAKLDNACASVEVGLSINTHPLIGSSLDISSIASSFVSAAKVSLAFPLTETAPLHKDKHNISDMFVPVL